MFCNQCGATLSPQQATCPACGRPVPATPAAAVYAPVPARTERERLAGHLRLLAILWFIVAFLWLIPAGALLAFSSVAGAVIPPDEPGAAIARAVGPLVVNIVALFVGVVAAACFAAGWGLLKLKPWARTLAIVLGVISLLHPPFGTALGVYTLWVLLSGNAAAEYDRMALAVPSA